MWLELKQGVCPLSVLRKAEFLKVRFIGSLAELIKSRFLGPTIHLLCQKPRRSRYLHFNKLPSWFFCIRRFENHWEDHTICKKNGENLRFLELLLCARQWLGHRHLLYLIKVLQRLSKLNITMLIPQAREWNFYRIQWLSQSHMAKWMAASDSWRHGTFSLLHRDIRPFHRIHRTQLGRGLRGPHTKHVLSFPFLLL